MWSYALRSLNTLQNRSSAIPPICPELQVAQLLKPQRRVILVAVHPADEILGCAGLLQQLGPEQDLTLVSLTNGCYQQGTAQQRLSVIRPQESLEALRRLGLDMSRLKVIRAGLPEGELAHCQRATELWVRKYLRPADLVIAPWSQDADGDHAAVGLCIERLCRSLNIELLQVPLWREPEPCSERNKAEVLNLSHYEQARKRHALQAFDSLLHGDPDTGISPLFDEHHWMRLSCASEVFLHAN